MDVPAIEPALASPNEGRGHPPRVHHIAIQTRDLENCQAWYRDYFGCEVSWSLGAFSELTRRRLPGIRQLVELVVGDVRLHLFERAASRAHEAGANVTQFQHVCVSVGSRGELARWRDRWLELFASGRYRFARPEPPSEIVVDDAGVASFYALDVDGLELELTYDPGGAP